MKKSISLLALASILAAGTAYGSGYRIPEQSADSVAKAGAHIASSTGADSSYYNPANMGFADDAWLTEIDLTYIHLTSIDYTDARTPAFNGSSEKENFLLPTFFVVSPDYNNFRFGLSFTAPYGLAKQWKDPYPALFARKFELEVFDLNLIGHLTSRLGYRCWPPVTKISSPVTKSERSKKISALATSSGEPTR